ncbi:hypothetical protein C8F01DRAFT_1144982, partial [Mycena amicta]
MSSTSSSSTVRQPSSVSSSSSSGAFPSSSASSIAPSGLPPPPPTSTDCPTGPGTCGTAPPATLYLYTFLSTLVIIALVSAGIIARSVHLRRRARMNGPWQHPARRETRIPRSRPKMFDVYIESPPNPSKRAAETDTNQERDRWSEMKPCSALRTQLPSITTATVSVLVSMPWLPQNVHGQDEEEEEELPYLELGVVQCQYVDTERYGAL